MKGHVNRIKRIEQILIPIEYRELRHPKKSQGQGIIEMWSEVITPEEARRIAFQKMQSFEKKTYELRLVIWETRFVPLVDGDNVDIYVRVNFDPTGWSDDEVEKTTDTHNGSMTGWGVFRWRMKFSITTPC